METQTKWVIGIVVVLALFFWAAVAWGATSFNFNQTLTLSPGEYCLDAGHELDGNKLTVHTTVTNGACTGDGETIVIEGEAEADEPEEPEPVDVPAECPLDEYNVVEVGANADYIRGTSGDDLIVAGSGVKVRGRGGNDCIVTGSGSKVYGQGGDDFIITGSGSWVRGGTGDDVCFAGTGSNVKCEIALE